MGSIINNENLSSLFNKSQDYSNSVIEDMKKKNDEQKKDAKNNSSNIKEKKKNDVTTKDYVLKENHKKAKRKRDYKIPYKHKDPINRSLKSIKMSPITDIVLTNFKETFATNKSKDEIIQLALFEHICNRLSPDDRKTLYTFIQSDVEIFRDQNPIYIEKSEDNIPIKTEEEIKYEFNQKLKDSLQIEINKNK